MQEGLLSCQLAAQDPCLGSGRACPSARGCSRVPWDRWAQGRRHARCWREWTLAPGQPFLQRCFFYLQSWLLLTGRCLVKDQVTSQYRMPRGSFL